MKGVGGGRRVGHIGPGVQKEREGPPRGARWRREVDQRGKQEDKLAWSFQVCAKAETLKRQEKEALPGKQENRGGGSLVIRENLTKGPKGGKNHCDGEVAEKPGER